MCINHTRADASFCTVDYSLVSCFKMLVLFIHFLQWLIWVIFKISDNIIISWHVIQMLSHKTLVMLLGMDPSENPDQPLPAHHPQVTFAYTKHLWMSDRREEAYKYVPDLFQLPIEKTVRVLSYSFILVYNKMIKFTMEQSMKCQRGVEV